MNNEHYNIRPFKVGELLTFTDDTGDKAHTKVIDITRHTTTRVAVSVLNKRKGEIRTPIRYYKDKGFCISMLGKYGSKTQAYWL